MIEELCEFLKRIGWCPDEANEVHSAYYKGGIEAGVEAIKCFDDAKHDYSGEMREDILRWQTENNELPSLREAAQGRSIRFPCSKAFKQTNFGDVVVVKCEVVPPKKVSFAFADEVGQKARLAGAKKLRVPINQAECLVRVQGVNQNPFDYWYVWGRSEKLVHGNPNVVVLAGGSCGFDKTLSLPVTMDLVEAYLRGSKPEAWKELPLAVLAQRYLAGMKDLPDILGRQQTSTKKEGFSTKPENKRL